MKTNLFSYNSILFTLIIILISTITIWKLPQTQNGYTHIGIAVYDMDDTFINDYVTKLQNKIDRSSFSGKKVLYEIFDAEGNANRQEHQLQYMYTQNFDALLINLVTPSSAASVLNETANHDIPVILFNREGIKRTYPSPNRHGTSEQRQKKQEPFRQTCSRMYGIQTK